MSNFVAELKPKPFPSTGQNSYRKDEFVAEIRSKSSRQNSALQIHNLGLSCEASDSDIQQMISEKKFSREGLIHLLERSLVTLVEKLLTGRKICNIEGALCVSFYGNECPLIVNLQKQFLDISNSYQTEHIILEKQQTENLLPEKRQTENLLLEKRQTENLILEKGQPENLFLEKPRGENRLQEKHQPAHLLLENCLNVKVKARDTAALHVPCNSPGISSSPGNMFERDPCHSPVETDCGLTAPPESLGGRARCLSSCVPNNNPESPVNNGLSSTTNLIHITRRAFSASTSPNPDGVYNEIQLRFTEDDCPIYKESDAESGYLSNEKEDSDVVSDHSKDEKNKCSEKSVEGYNDYFCSGFDGPSSRYVSLESLVSDDFLGKLEDCDSYGSSAEGSDEMEEDGDEDCERRLVIDENALNDSKIENMIEKIENRGRIENCCSPSKSVTGVSNLIDVKPMLNLDEEERMIVESEDVESTDCLDVAETQTNEEPHGNSGFDWNHVPGTPHPQHIVPTHLRKYLNKGRSPIQPGATVASLQVPCEQGVHVCNHGFRTFTVKNNLKRHLRHHTGQRPYKCTSCPQSFFGRDDLKGHTIRHKYTKPFRCSRCQKGYTDRACIKNHMAKEHGSRLMHVCPQCGESFDCEEAFACHKSTHPELKQFACTTCSFIGTNKLMFMKHRLLHSHKLFSCKPCNAYFADPFHYTSHVRKHKKMTSFTQYVCCFCDMILSTYERLVRHENSHAQCKIHACSICQKQFRSKILLRDHLMTHEQPAQIVTEQALPKTGDVERTQWDDEQKHFLCNDVNLLPKPIDFKRQRNDYLVEKTSAQTTEKQNDEYYGQLLDLSMKKSPSLKSTNDSINISDQNQIGSYNTSVRATDTSVNDGSRNGASSSDPARLSRECGFRRSGFAPDHTLKTALLDDSSLKLMLSNFTNVARSPELGVYGSHLSPVSSDKPTPFMDATNSHALLEPSFARRSRRADRAHHIQGVSDAVSDKKLWSRTACSQPSGKPLVFSPYNREKMADLAAKFMVARGSKLVGEKGRLKVISAREEEWKVADVCQQSAAQKQESHLGKVSGTSPMDTEGSCKNAVLDLTGQAHQENDTVGSEYSNMETSLRCHIPTVVKSEPLKEQDANARSPLDFRFRALKAYGDESRSSAGGSHSCDMCREVFGTFMELEDHSVEVHKRYLCEHCKKGFTARPNRDRHVRYHTGERPYKCDICDLAFFRGDDLKYHRTTRHPTAQPFMCPRCSASFTWGRDLEKHIRHSKCKV